MDDWVRFLQWALPRLRLEWAGFRKVRGQSIKRIRRRLREIGLETIDDYREYLKTHPDEWSILDELCRITISRFWRDREVFERLRVDVLPHLDQASVWSAGCASGEEPYSVVIAWHFGPAPSSSKTLRVLATDADGALLERARRGLYSRGTLRELSPGWIDRAFIARGDLLELRSELRSTVELRQQDLRRELPDETFSLILCRNLVLTYFEPALRSEVMGQILDRLAIGGVLVIGGHESIPAALAHRLAPWEDARATYRRVS